MTFTMLRRIWDLIVRMVKSLFDSAPDPRESENARAGHEGLLARIAAARSRVQGVQDQLEHGVASCRREAATLLDEARRLVDGGRDDAARVVLRRRQAVLERVRVLDGQLERVVLEDQALASAGERLESEIAIWSARHDLSAARYDAAEVRAKVTETLTDVSDEFSELLVGLRDADERAECMEAHADALDELVEIGVLSLSLPTREFVTDESPSDEVETLLAQIRCEAGAAPVDAPLR